MAVYNKELLRRARLVKGWGVEQMAARIRMTTRTVYRVENGETAKPETIKRMADTLGLNMEDVVS